MLGCFTADLCVGTRQVESEIVVIKGTGPALLGKETASKLGILEIRVNINNVQTGEVSGTQRVLDKHGKCFEGFEKLKDFQLRIPVDNNVDPVVQPVRRTPYHLRDKLAEKLDELEALDIIEKADGPSSWVSSVVVIPKSDDDIRLCVDMREANKAVERERFPIPTIDDVLQEMSESKVFSKIDIKWAYHQIEQEPNSRDITTFATHQGNYRYKRLNFGVSCAPEMYQKTLQQILHDCPGSHNILDDIVCHGENEREHDERLDKLLTTLENRGLTLHRDKWKFNIPRFEFMGHVLSEQGMGPSEVKVRAVMEAREPKSATEVGSFLVLVNFSARYIDGLATISEPLRSLTRKGEPFVWTSEQANTFQALQEALSRAPTLAYCNKNAKTRVIADASPVGLGAVLLQENKGEWRTVCYASRSLTDIEKRYSKTEKEALGLVWACERFHAYIYGQEFELLTDCKPLEFIYSPFTKYSSKPSARIERWVLRLQPYTYKVVHIPDRENIADCLSRLLTTPTQTPDSHVHKDTEDYVKFVAREATPVALSTREIERVGDGH